MRRSDEARREFASRMRGALVREPDGRYRELVELAERRTERYRRLMGAMAARETGEALLPVRGDGDRRDWGEE